MPCATAADARIAIGDAAARSAAWGWTTRPSARPTASDWVFLADVPAVKIGPGRSELSHTPDEHVEAAEVERAVAVYAAIATAYFS